MGWKRPLASSILRHFASSVVAGSCPLAVSSLVIINAGNISKVASMKFPDVESARMFVQHVSLKELSWWDKQGLASVKINCKAERSLQHRAGFKCLGEVRSRLTTALLALPDAAGESVEVSSTGPKGGIYFSKEGDSHLVAQIVEAEGSFDVSFDMNALHSFQIAKSADSIRSESLAVVNAFLSSMNSNGPQPFSG
jgi:hypothetical protein